ncbi:hypothetical protein BD779DRAFT_1803940 [Infundibulicybe gibba]|nr:hypothetical protein BD779DRAFT_1803940 [Infundibulicybe gibba]
MAAVVPNLDTLPKLNRAHEADHLSGDLTQGRTAVLEEVSAAPVVPLTWFLNLLPPGSEDGSNANVQDIKKALISNGAWKNQEPKGWSAFPTTPRASELGEKEIFQGFQQVVEAIATATGYSKINSYLTEPKTAPLSKRNNKPRPDGFFVLGDVAGATGPSWPKIICSAAFRRSRGKGECEDNAKKTMWSLYQVMREDARRRFTFGITIEDTSTRLWFASRSIILVSRHFNFMKKPEPLIRMIIFLIYASKEQLGYDMTMHRNQSQLAIDLGGRTSQTKELLADFAADSPLGRGTRFWSGLFIGDPERKQAALKDCLVECDRELEGDVLIAHRRGYGKLGNSSKPNFNEKMIMHAKTTLMGGVEGDTQTMMNGNSWVVDRWLDLKHNPKQPCWGSCVASTSIGLDPQEVKCTAHDELNFKKRRHYHISFEEVGKPLHQVVSLRDYVTALRDIVIVIEVLRQFGCVHLNIGSANVLFYKGGGRLSDFDCKPSPNPGEHDGTPNFMPVEVTARRRLFQPRDHTRYSPPPFQYFTLHDIESVWWLLAFALVGNGIQDEPPSIIRENRQVEFARGMFPNTLTSALRRDYFTMFDLFARKKHTLPPVLHPLFDIAESLRDRLVMEYINAEKKVALNHKRIPRTLSHFRKTLEKAMELSGGIILVPI